MKRLLISSWKRDLPILHRSYLMYWVQIVFLHIPGPLYGVLTGGLATILHCNDFSARFSRDVSTKCLADASFFLTCKNLESRCNPLAWYENKCSITFCLAKRIYLEKGPFGLSMMVSFSSRLVLGLASNFTNHSLRYNQVFWSPSYPLCTYVRTNYYI